MAEQVGPVADDGAYAAEAAAAAEVARKYRSEPARETDILAASGEWDRRTAGESLASEEAVRCTAWVRGLDFSDSWPICDEAAGLKGRHSSESMNGCHGDCQMKGWDQGPLDGQDGCS